VSKHMTVGTWAQKILLHVPSIDIAELDRLIEQGYYPNINEAIRFAVKDLIRQHREMGHLER